MRLCPVSLLSLSLSAPCEILSLLATHTAQGCLCSCYWRITQFTSLDTCRASECARGGKICHVDECIYALRVRSQQLCAATITLARAVVALNRQPGRQTCPAKCLVRIMQHKTHTLSCSLARSLALRCARRILCFVKRQQRTRC
jgi:hypothetical protein